MYIQKFDTACPNAIFDKFANHTLSSWRNVRIRSSKTGHPLKHFIWFVVFVVVGFIGVEQASADPKYADWTLISGTNGTGTFNGVTGMPDFTFTLTEDLIPSSTQIDDNDVFDNLIWEGLFGEGDNQESLRFRSPGLDEFDNDLLTISTLTLTFDAPVDLSGMWAFAVTDLEGEDAVISASLNGIPVPDAIVVSWFQQFFDSKPATDGSPHLPSGFDQANVAVVAQVDEDGLLSDETFNNFEGLVGGSDGTESASAWFIPNTPIDTLTITHRNRFGFGASMHVYIAVKPALIDQIVALKAASWTQVSDRPTRITANARLAQAIQYHNIGAANYRQTKYSIGNRYLNLAVASINKFIATLERGVRLNKFPEEEVLSLLEAADSIIEEIYYVMDNPEAAQADSLI